MTTVTRPAITRRACLGAAVATAAGPAFAAAPAVDAVVGAGGYASLAEALAKAPADGARPYRILLRRGVWREKPTVDKPNIQLIGESRRETVLAFDAFASQIAPDGQPWGTRRSATLTVRAPDFTARNLTIANSFDIAQARPPSGAAVQAVALALEASSDRAFLSEVDITGFQDTLFADSGRALFRHCRISGTVDFIFGGGTAVFDRCEVVSRARQMPGEGRLGYVAAPSTLVRNPYGLVFDRCRLTREAAVRDGAVALGRPWRPTTTFADGRYGDPGALGQAVYLRCWMDRHIDPVGWDSMGYNARGGGRAMLRPEEARFFEFASRGPGARAGDTRRQLSAAEAAGFAQDRVLAGWRPSGR